MNNKKLIIVLMFLFIFSFTMLNTFGEEKTDVPKKVLKLEKKGDKALKKKEYDKALEYFKQANEMYPNYDKVHYKIAYIYYINKKYEEALKELKIAFDLNKENANIRKLYVDTLIKVGLKLEKERNIKDANAMFIDIVNIPGYSKVEPKLVNEMLYRIGLNFNSTKDFKNSNEYLLKFINNSTSKTDFPKFYPKANYFIGVNYLRLKDNENSIKYLETYIELNQDNLEDRYLPYAKFIIGTNNFIALKEKVNEIRKSSNKKNRKANKQKIIKLASESKGIESNLLFAIGKTNKLDEPAYLNLGNYYYLKNDIKNSLKFYKILVDKFPNSQDLDIYKAFYKGLKSSSSK